MANCPQTVLEPLLLQAAREAGADIRFETEAFEGEEKGDGVTSRIRNRRTDEVTVVAPLCDVIGADGVWSKVADRRACTRRSHGSRPGGQRVVPRGPVPGSRAPPGRTDLERDARSIRRCVSER